ncbi:hypothetical protein C8J57DRAFT_1724460 [Mycena rebaudengoi]|nr:hypothetical protein C8J57DRAFT_1724460 [Mycena rebaudengoi]
MSLALELLSAFQIAMPPSDYSPRRHGTRRASGQLMFQSAALLPADPSHGADIRRRHDSSHPRVAALCPRQDSATRCPRLGFAVRAFATTLRRRHTRRVGPSPSWVPALSSYLPLPIRHCPAAGRVHRRLVIIDLLTLCLRRLHRLLLMQQYGPQRFAPVLGSRAFCRADFSALWPGSCARVGVVEARILGRMELPALDVLGGSSWIPPLVEASTPHPCFRRRMAGLFARAPTSVTSVASPSGCSGAAPFRRCADVWSSGVVVRVAADVQCDARAARIFDPYVSYRRRRREESYPSDPGPAGKERRRWAWAGKRLRLHLRLVCGLTPPVLPRCAASRMPRTRLLSFQISYPRLPPFKSN